MAKEKMSLSSLGEMGGGVLNRVVTKALEELGHDCVDRPDLKKARQVVVTFDITPNPEDGVADEVFVSWKLRTKRPPVQSRDYSVQVHPKGALLVNEDSPDAPRQRTLDEAGPRGAEDDDAIASGAAAPSRRR